MFNDDNVKVRGHDDKPEDDFNLDMRESLLFSTYLNLAATYIKLSHFTMAKQALRDAMTIKRANSLVLFRMS